MYQLHTWFLVAAVAFLVACGGDSVCPTCPEAVGSEPEDSTSGPEADLLSDAGTDPGMDTDPDPGLDVAVEDMAVEDMAAEDVAVEDMAVEDMAAEDVAVEDMAVEDVVAEDVAAEDIAAEDVPFEECVPSGPCAVTSFVPGVGCVEIDLEGLPCDDGDVCTWYDICVDGVCTSDTVAVCDDGNFCTDDSCDGTEGCIFSANSQPCDDGDPCTGNDQCLDGQCAGVNQQSCGDDVVCGSEQCDDGNDVQWDGCATCQLGEFAVNAYTADDQAFPSAVHRQSGGYLVFWESEGQDGDQGGIFGRLLDAQGVLSDTEIQVNSTVVSAQSHVHAAAKAGGGAIVVWQSFGQDGAQAGVVGRTVSDDGVPVSDEFIVNQQSAGMQVAPAAASWPDGRFVVAWTTFAPPDNKFAIRARLYQTDDQAAGDFVPVSSVTSAIVGNAMPAVLSDGRFVVVWESNEKDGAGNGIVGRVFSAAGLPESEEFVINELTSGSQARADIVALPQGGFAVVWAGDSPEGNETDIRLRTFSSALAGAAEMTVNSFMANAQKFPRVTADANGIYTVVWQSQWQDGSDYGVFLQRFSAEGVPAGGETGVNLFNLGNQDYPVVATGPGGSFAIFWRSAGQDGSGAGVFARRYSNEGSPLLH